MSERVSRSLEPINREAFNPLLQQNLSGSLGAELSADAMEQSVTQLANEYTNLVDQVQQLQVDLQQAQTQQQALQQENQQLRDQNVGIQQQISTGSADVQQLQITIEAARRELQTVNDSLESAYLTTQNTSRQLPAALQLSRAQEIGLPRDTLPGLVAGFQQAAAPVVTALGSGNTAALLAALPTMVTALRTIGDYYLRYSLLPAFTAGLPAADKNYFANATADLVGQTLNLGNFYQALDVLIPQLPPQQRIQLIELRDEVTANMVLILNAVLSVFDTDYTRGQLDPNVLARLDAAVQANATQLGFRLATGIQPE